MSVTQVPSRHRNRSRSGQPWRFKRLLHGSVMGCSSLQTVDISSLEAVWFLAMNQAASNGAAGQSHRHGRELWIGQADSCPNVSLFAFLGYAPAVMETLDIPRAPDLNNAAQELGAGRPKRRHSRPLELWEATRSALDSTLGYV